MNKKLQFLFYGLLVCWAMYAGATANTLTGAIVKSLIGYAILKVIFVAIDCVLRRERQ